MAEMNTVEQTDKQQIERAKTLAGEYNKEGWGSRSAVLHAIYDIFETGIPHGMFKIICGILDGFHPGAAGLYEHGRGFGITLCGALSGAIASFGMVHGCREIPYKIWTEGMKPDGWLNNLMNDPEATPNEKARSFVKHSESYGYGGYYQITARFKEHFGTTHCIDLVKPYGHYVTEECFRNCHKIIIWTAGMVAQIISEYERCRDSQQIGDGNPHIYILAENKI